MTDEKKTGETSETPYPGTLGWAATRLLEAIGEAAKAVAEMLWESIARVFRDAPPAHEEAREGARSEVAAPPPSRARPLAPQQPVPEEHREVPVMDGKYRKVQGNG